MTTRVSWESIPEALPLHPPPPTRGVRQHCTAVWPPLACPKCGNPLLDIKDYSAWCRGLRGGCGLITYRVSDAPPVPYNTKLRLKGDPR